MRYFLLLKNNTLNHINIIKLHIIQIKNIYLIIKKLRCIYILVNYENFLLRYHVLWEII